MSGWRVLTVILIVAAAVRFYALGRASFWYDEFGSLETSTGRGLLHLQLPVNRTIENPPDLTSLQGAPPIWKIWTSLNLDNHPPLYFMVLRTFRDCLGDSEWVARLPSAMCSLVALIFFYFVVRMQLSEAGALAATGLMAVAGSQITLAQEARPYMLWLALSLVCGWVVLRIEKFGMTIRRWILLCLLAYGSLITHYFAAIILLSLIIYAVIRLRGKQRWTTLGAFVLAFIFFAATWGVFLLRQLHTLSSNNAWQYDPSSHHLGMVVWYLIQLPTRWLSEPAADWIPVTILIAAWCVYALFHNSRNATRCGSATRRVAAINSGLLFWLLWACLLIAAIIATDIARHARSLMFMRYTFAAGPALFFLAGSAIQTWRHGWIVPALLGLLCIATISDAYSKVIDWREVAARLKSNVHAGDTIIYTPGANDASWAQTTLLGISHYAPNLHSGVVILTDPQIAPNYFTPGHFTWVLCTDPNLPANALAPAATVVRTGVAPSIGRVSELKP